MHPLDRQAGLGPGAWPVDLPVVLGADPLEGDPHRGGPQLRGGRQHLPPVLTDGERHPGGGQRLELCRADMVGEQPQQLRCLGVGGHLMHRVGAKAEPVLVAEPVGLLQHPGDVTERHRLVGDALRPAVPAHRGAAHHLDLQIELGDHRGHQYPTELVDCQATLRRPLHIVLVPIQGVPTTRPDLSLAS